jgi:cytochrome c oxidase assembly protein subunit 15
MIGLVYALPLIFFWVRGLIPQGYHLKFTLMLFLGGAQAVMGWYMVESGLVDQPAVSHYRLAAHLGLAFIIFACLIRLSMNFITFPQWLFPKNKAALQKREIKNLRLWAFAALIITMIWGAFTAGLDAGKIYNTYPFMGGSFFPVDAGSLSPFIVNFFESHAGVQFAHRWIALTALILVALLAMRTRHYALKGMIVLQFTLGIATLLSNVHIALASLHQAGALILISLLVINASAQKYNKI